MNSIIQQFREAAQAAGVTLPDEVSGDGALHRFSTNAKPRDSAGWYVLHLDAVPAGAFGCWRAQVNETWCSKSRDAMTDAERAAHTKRVADMKAQRDADEMDRHETARERAQGIWDYAESVSDDHSYLRRKGASARGCKVSRGRLVVPIRDVEGVLWSLQFIWPDGTKRFLTGGRKRGCFHLLGDIGATEPLCIAEGYATGASVHEATRYAVAVAFDCGNLLPVAQALRERFPTRKLVLCADDDHRTFGNPGVTKATEAARAIGGLLAVPAFGESRADDQTDFNDLHQTQELDSVRACIELALDDWPELKHFDRGDAVPDPFPLDALPGLIGAAVKEYQAYGQQPMSLVASSALGVVSLAAQGLADVARDDHLIGPLSLDILIVASSGERKTAADKWFGSVLFDWERERADTLADAIRRREVEIAGWESANEGIKASIKKASAAGPSASARSTGESAELLQQKLTDHALKKPSKLFAPRLLYEDVNPQSLVSCLATGHPSAALWSDEAGMVTGSHGMGPDSFIGFLAMLNRFWDGGVIRHDRKQAESLHVEGRRLTVSLMVQPAVLGEVTQRAGGLTRGTGFLARFLVCQPISTMGDRPYRAAPSGMYRAEFSKRVRALLDSELATDEQGRLKPSTLRLSPEAFEIWRKYHDAVERELRPMGDYEPVRDFAAKSADNAARIAGVLHVFDSGALGAISATTMQNAVKLAHWYLREALRTLSLLDEPQAWSDARLLDAWLAKVGDSSPRDISNGGPNSLRKDTKRRDAAIAFLVELGRVRYEAVGKGRRIVRNPALLPAATAKPATVATVERVQAPLGAEVAGSPVAAPQNVETEVFEI